MYYFKFENHEGIEHNIAGRRYTVQHKPGIAIVTIWPLNLAESTQEYMLIPHSKQDWQRMYVMNEFGKTIATLRTNEIPDKSSEG